MRIKYNGIRYKLYFFLFFFIFLVFTASQEDIRPVGERAGDFSQDEGYGTGSSATWHIILPRRFRSKVVGSRSME